MNIGRARISRRDFGGWVVDLPAMEFRHEYNNITYNYSGVYCHRWWNALAQAWRMK